MLEVSTDGRYNFPHVVDMQKGQRILGGDQLEMFKLTLTKTRTEALLLGIMDIPKKLLNLFLYTKTVATVIHAQKEKTKKSQLRKSGRTN